MDKACCGEGQVLKEKARNRNGIIPNMSYMFERLEELEKRVEMFKDTVEPVLVPVLRDSGEEVVGGANYNSSPIDNDLCKAIDIVNGIICEIEKCIGRCTIKV